MWFTRLLSTLFKTVNSWFLNRSGRWNIKLYAAVFCWGDFILCWRTELATTEDFIHFLEVTTVRALLPGSHFIMINLYRGWTSYGLATTLRSKITHRHCPLMGKLWRTKQSTPLPTTLHSKQRCALRKIGGSPVLLRMSSMWFIWKKWDFLVG